MPVLKSGQFAGVSANDTFAIAALRQAPIIYHLPPVQWPAGLQPTTAPLGKYAPGTKITSALNANADVLLVLYTDQETMALLDVMTGDPDWTAKTKAGWCEYGHTHHQHECTWLFADCNEFGSGRSRSRWQRISRKLWRFRWDPYCSRCDAGISNPIASAAYHGRRPDLQSSH